MRSTATLPATSASCQEIEIIVIRRKRGLGSGREGVGHWWMQRMTAVALVAPTLWFVTLLIGRARNDYGTFILWLRTPLTTVMMVLLLIVLFYHMGRGLQVDYVRTDRIKKPIVVVTRFGCVSLSVAGITATLRIAIGE
jgi:succinate dehydrogenase / fumarate reductase membrane anchor subunit